MGLSSWIQQLLPRKKSAALLTRTPREDFLQLFLTRLEDRRVLSANVSFGGDTLTLNTFDEMVAGTENLTIRETGTDFEFVLSEGPWSISGSVPTGVEIDTMDASVLKVNNDLVNTDLTIQNIQVDLSGVTDGTVEFTSNTDLSGLLRTFTINGATDVTQSVGTTVSILNLDASADTLTLDETTNDFGTVTISTTGEARLRDSGTLTLNDITTGGDFTVDAVGVLTLAGNINTDGTTATGDEPAGMAGAVNINTVLMTGTVELGDNVVIDSDATMDGAVSIMSTIDSDGTARNFSIESGDANTTLSDDLGASDALNDVNINSASGTGAIVLQNIGSTGTAGANSVNVGNSNSASIDFQGSNYITTTAQVYRAAAGSNFTINTAGTNTFQALGTANADNIEFRDSGKTQSVAARHGQLEHQASGFVAVEIAEFHGQPVRSTDRRQVIEQSNAGQPLDGVDDETRCLSGLGEQALDFAH